LCGFQTALSCSPIDNQAIIRYNVASGEFTQLALSPKLSEQSSSFYIEWLDDSRLVILNDAASIATTDDELFVVDILTGEVTPLTDPR